MRSLKALVATVFVRVDGNVSTERRRLEGGKSAVSDLLNQRQYSWKLNPALPEQPRIVFHMKLADAFASERRDLPVNVVTTRK